MATGAQRRRRPSRPLQVGLLAGLLVAGGIGRADEAPRELSGRVAAVADGDTLTLRSGGRSVRVRLAQIDAPEMDQPYGPAARRALSRLALDRRARVVVVDTDRYGRTVGEVFIDGQHLNERLVRDGHAWAYTRYSPSTAIVALEDAARAAQRGLWALPASERDPPWAWRHAASDRRARDAEPPAPGCRPRASCARLATCAEARFQLEHCGATRLDGDGDGVPCEALCSSGGDTGER